MDRSNVEEIAQLVKAHRLQKKYTQQELSVIAGISLRSIQRIENAEVLPRMYTLKMLSDHLGFTLEHTEKVETVIPAGLNVIQKGILSLSTALLLFLLAGAYVFQSPRRFPETEFELFLYVAGVLSLYTGIMLKLWK
ncbi:helix-turn-helix domain-containing protein [Pedobacter metabolipauper]|uniref:Helix-turn-helix protein n=1 Tax=Pedobacter metabolipauper TaxID=425513 RepID=A0A4V3D1F9_9SPHI|nr:helix-turn-helix transcriptional regulator [Pedobacter metabolipauper]TDQ11053.1 helix-turn-helix protein [Pedobacter metabolipauper]